MSRARLFLDSAKEALEDAAYVARLDADRSGVFLRGLRGDEGDSPATDVADVAGELGLRGPAVTVPGAAAFAAVERACQSLSSGECDLALAGETPVHGGGGEGMGVVVLKRLPEALADGDRILAVIRGSAVHALEPPPAAVPRARRGSAEGAETAGEPGPVRARPELANAYTPPADRLEAAIASLWQEELGLDRVGVDDNFFELGGTSIAGVRIIAVLKEWLHQDIPTVSLYEGPTVSALTRLLLHSGPPRNYDAVRERGERRRRKLQRLGHGARQEAAE
jgi:acyl carrier protein